jgi:hypothetical protein
VSEAWAIKEIECTFDQRSSIAWEGETFSQRTEKLAEPIVVNYYDINMKLKSASRKRGDSVTGLGYNARRYGLQFSEDGDSYYRLTTIFDRPGHNPQPEDKYFAVMSEHLLDPTTQPWTPNPTHVYGWCRVLKITDNPYE